MEEAPTGRTKTKKPGKGKMPKNNFRGKSVGSTEALPNRSRTLIAIQAGNA